MFKHLSFSVLSRSLLFRLLSGTLTAIVLALLASGIMLDELFARQALRQAEVQLDQQLDHLIVHLAFDNNAQPQITGNALSDPRWQKPYSGLYGQITAANGTVVWRSRSLWDDIIPPTKTLLATKKISTASGPNHQDLLLLSKTVKPEDQSSTWTISVAINQQPLNESLREFRHTLWILLSALALLLLFAATLQAYVMMRPLKHIKRALSNIYDGKEKSLQGNFPLEIEPLVHQFNHVLNHNEALVTRARQNAGNLAHALKTPLTILEQTAQQPITADNQSEITQHMKLQIDIAKRYMEWHLARARADAVSPSLGQRSSVNHVAQGLIRVLQKVYADRHLDFQNHLPSQTIWFAGEEQDLQEMMGNLLDNACKWAAKTVQIKAEITPDTTQNTLRIMISDDGPGIRDESQALALSRGGRLDELVSGSGLGLAIVADLARNYQGELKLNRSSWGGLQASLYLPLAATHSSP
jgi:signal transduction histidine kinase